MKNKPESFQPLKPFNTLRNKEDSIERRIIEFFDWTKQLNIMQSIQMTKLTTLYMDGPYMIWTQYYIKPNIFWETLNCWYSFKYCAMRERKCIWQKSENL